jgi:hypothetical protein
MAEEINSEKLEREMYALIERNAEEFCRVHGQSSPKDQFNNPYLMMEQALPYVLTTVTKRNEAILSMQTAIMSEQKVLTRALLHESKWLSALTWVLIACSAVLIVLTWLLLWHG